MFTAPILLLLLVIVMLGLAACTAPRMHPRLHWGWLAMALWALKVLIERIA